jgi:hypothetical protein
MMQNEGSAMIKRPVFVFVWCMAFAGNAKSEVPQGPAVEEVILLDAEGPEADPAVGAEMPQGRLESAGGPIGVVTVRDLAPEQRSWAGPDGGASDPPPAPAVLPETYASEEDARAAGNDASLR